MHATLPLLAETDFPPVKRGRLETLQVNLGYLCNQQCLHCHVDASPRRTEVMSKENVDTIIRFIATGAVNNLDLTGGAPEMNPYFRYLVEQARAYGVHVIDRCNLTVLTEPGQEQLAEFLAVNKVEIVASLPCYSEANVDGQRGKGVFERSLEGIRLLNAQGYGQGNGQNNDGLQLNLMYNPGGAFLPPSQEQLEVDYKRELQQKYQLQFNHLFTLTNMPIKRFGSTLVSKGQFDEYMQLLKSAYSDANLSTVMCRSLVSVDWQGYLYDCDFNQMLDLPLIQNGKRKHISELNAGSLIDNDIVIADHCYGCTAGQGSSCGGALSD